MPVSRREGRLTIGLYNSYDRNRFTEAHRRTLARAGAVAAAFHCNLVTFAFPYHLMDPEDASLAKDPRRIAARVARSTTIGAAGTYFTDLAEAGRFHVEGDPGKGFPPQYGTPVLATSRVEGAASATGEALASRLSSGESLLLVVGIGPHGFPRSLEKVVRDRWDLTGRGMSLETCTALSAAPAILTTHLLHMRDLSHGA
ncbi:MAG: DUF531 domain-containing protein [Euryarchaeota archaeon]|nr:DUF531 domain-containing protein [Euryarchaeota archaeon]